MVAGLFLMILPAVVAVVQVESFSYSTEVNLNSDGWFMLKLNSTSPTDSVSNQMVYVTVYDNSSVLREYCRYEDYYSCARYQTSIAGISTGHFFIDDAFVVGNNYTLQIEVAGEVVTGEFAVVEMRSLDYSGDWIVWIINNLHWIVMGIIIFAVAVLVVRYIVSS